MTPIWISKHGYSVAMVAGQSLATDRTKGRTADETIQITEKEKWGIIRKMYTYIHKYMDTHIYMCVFVFVLISIIAYIHA